MASLSRSRPHAQCPDKAQTGGRCIVCFSCLFFSSLSVCFSGVLGLVRRADAAVRHLVISNSSSVCVFLFVPQRISTW